MQDEADEPEHLAGIEYHGVAGSSEDCERAVLRLLVLGPRIIRAQILTSGNHHALLLFNEFKDPIAIKSGFASGYGGAGPTALSRVLQFLWKHDVDVEEIGIEAGLLTRLDRSGLTSADLEAIEAARPLRPSRWASDYIRDAEHDAAYDRTLWSTLPPAMPFAILDSRLLDLALKFDDDPDACLNKGYRQLEDIIRAKTGLEDFGARLLSKAFQGDKAALTWDVPEPAEVQGRANLFAAVFMAFRNPRAHRLSSRRDLAEFLLLNQLYILEADATLAGSERRN